MRRPQRILRAARAGNSTDPRARDTARSIMLILSPLTTNHVMARLALLGVPAVAQPTWGPLLTWVGGFGGRGAERRIRQVLCHCCWACAAVGGS
mgnify:CR=1 FL=1